MFKKLYQLVKENAGTAILENAEVPVKFQEAAMNEASGTIIDVLKSQLESGKLNDLVRFFQLTGFENNVLIRSIVKKYANRLNKHYEISTESSLKIAEELIPVVMKKFVFLIRSNDKKQDVFSFLNILGGNTVNFEVLFGKINSLQLA